MFLTKPLKKIIVIVLAFIGLFAVANISSLAFAGEVPESKLDQIALGTKKEKIISVLGKPNFIRPEGVNAEGKIVERMEYDVVKRIGPPKVGDDTGQRVSAYTCSLMIADGVLVRIDRQR